MNLKRVYITGPDCTGKSTFAKALADAAGMKVTKFSYTPDHKKQAELWESYKDIVKQKDEPIILDRAWHGPYCYHGILGSQPYDELEMLSLSRQFVQSGGSILMFNAAAFKIADRMHSRGDEFIKTDQVMAIWKRYRDLRKLLSEHNIPFYVIDTTQL